MSDSRKRALEGGTDNEHKAKKARVEGVDVEGGAPEEEELDAFDTITIPYPALFALPPELVTNPEIEIDSQGRKIHKGPTIRIRDLDPKTQEKNGTLKFISCRNTGIREDLRNLAELKEIIARQLPNMPKDYITRLVFDLNHASVIGMMNDKPIGGITFKPFDKPGFTKFIEIVFCAITASHQVRGYGSRLMSHMKVWAQKNGFEHMLTYADDFAIGYFQRQGFTLEIELPRAEWDIRFLKHYDSATLMHCQIDKRVDYLEIAEQLHVQRKAFIEKIRDLTTQHMIYDGPRDFVEKPNPPHGYLRLDPETLPGMKACGWDGANYRRLLSSDTQGTILKRNKEIYEAIMQDPEDLTWPFRAPVEELFPSEAAKYLTVVRDPIDLRTIGERLDNGYYITTEMLVADLYRMVENCQSYNAKDTAYYITAEKILDKHLVQHFIEVNLPD